MKKLILSSIVIVICLSSFSILKADERLKLQEKADRLFKQEGITPLRKYRQHFSSITCWALYGPWNLEGSPFKAEYLLISGDQFNQIFISDAITGEVFREYDCFVPIPVLGLWGGDEDDDADEEDGDNGYVWDTEGENVFYPRRPITHLEFSPQFRLFAYCDSDSYVHVRETLTGKILGYMDCDSILSIAFRSEPLNGCDILEVITRSDDRIYHKYYAFPLDASGDDLKDGEDFWDYKLENSEGVLIQEYEKTYFPAFGKDSGGTTLAGPKGLEQAIIVGKRNYEIQTKSMLKSEEESKKRKANKSAEVVQPATSNHKTPDSK